MNHDTLYVSRGFIMVTFYFKNLNIMTLIKPLVMCFLLNVYVKWVFIFYYIFVLELLFFVKVINAFVLSWGVTCDQYRACIGLFSSFRVIECSANFSETFFHNCLKILMFFILPFFKYFWFSSVNS